jgi:hypothetical protein
MGVSGSMKVVWHVIQGCGLKCGAIDSYNDPEQHVMLLQPTCQALSTTDSAGNMLLEASYKACAHI